MDRSHIERAYLEVSALEARKRRLNVGHLVAGYKRMDYAQARQAVFRELVARGYSYNSLAVVSGFDHTSVRYAVNDNVRCERYMRDRGLG